jgi:acyl-CoA thioesterase-1
MKSLIAIIILSFAVTPIATAKDMRNILVMGDSLSAGYGIQINDSWPVLLQSELNKKNLPYRVHNASISGQTSSEGVRQIDQLLTLTKPELVILELGANDGLRGLSISEMSSNLQSIITKSLMAKAQVLLIGIKVPANYGRRYGSMFEASFEQLAKNNGIPLIPFMLAPLLDIVTPDNKSEFIQADGLHPTAKAQPYILEYLMPNILTSLAD